MDHAFEAIAAAFLTQLMLYAAVIPEVKRAIRDHDQVMVDHEKRIRKLEVHCAGQHGVPPVERG